MVSHSYQRFIADIQSGVALERTDSQPIQKRRGQWKKGQSGNPKGRPPAGQSLKDRLAWWFETKTVGEINALIANQKEWPNLISADAAICQVVAQGSEKSGLPYIQFIFDRLLGKPPQAITGEDGKPLLPQQDIQEIARRTAFLLSMAMVSPDAAPLVLEHKEIPEKV